MRELASLLLLLALAAPHGDAGAPSLGGAHRCAPAEWLIQRDGPDAAGPLAHGFFVPSSAPALAEGEAPVRGGPGRDVPLSRRPGPPRVAPVRRAEASPASGVPDAAHRLLLAGFAAHPSTAPPSHA